MATEEKRIQRIIAPVSTIQNGQICIEPDNDVDLGYEAIGWKTADGDTHKGLAKDQHAQVSSIESATSITKNGVEVFVNGDQYIDLDITLSAPTEKTGRIFWDIDNDCPAYFDSQSGTVAQVPYEGLLRVANNTGSTLLNGRVVYGAGTTGTEVEVDLANAKTYDRNQVLAVLTHDIADGAVGKAVNFGVVRDFDTSSLIEGSRVFLDIIDGNLTSTRPVFPAKPIIVGQCISSHATTGSILVAIAQDQYDYEFDGCVIEKQDYNIISSGGSVYCDVALDGGGDLPVQIMGDIYLLNCTTGGGVGGWARVELTQGTDTQPQYNYVYVELVGGVATLKSSTTAPTGSYANVGYMAIFTAAKTLTDGPIMNRRTTDAVSHDGSGHIQHINERIRAMGSAWAREGMVPSVVINTAPTPDTVDFSITAGKFWQLHKQDSPVLDFATDGAYVLNTEGNGTLSMYDKITDINDLNEFTDGSNFSVNNRVNLIFILLGNKSTAECKLGVLLPNGSYADNSSAYYDTDGLTPLVVPNAVWDVAIPLIRLPLLVGPNTWSFINPAGKPQFIDIRGIGLNANSGGAGGVGSTTLAGLDDTSLSAPKAGETLKYDGTYWTNQAVNNFAAFEALRKASDKRVDLVMLGDSNQHFDGGGFDYAINNYLNALYGVYATPIGCEPTDSSQNDRNSYFWKGWTDESLPVEHRDYFPYRDGYGSFITTPTYQGSSGMIVKYLGEFNTESNLRWWLAWAGFDYGSGSFTPRIRMDVPPYTTQITGINVSTNTGDYSRQMTYLDLAAGTRAFNLQGGFSVSNTTITAPFSWLFERVEDLEKDNGMSCHSLYGVGGHSLHEFAQFLLGLSIQQLTGYFYEVRRLQLAKGQAPTVIVYINSGLNDRNETETSNGEYGFEGQTPSGYADNMSAIMNRIEDVWKINGWDISELSFLTIASHVISDPNDSELQSYRTELNSLSATRPNFTTVDLSQLMTYAEAVSGGWYDGAGEAHLTPTGYAAVTAKIFSLL